MYQYFNKRTLRGLGLGATECRNPLPAGQYTIDCYGDDRAKMATWVAQNQSNVIILATAAEDGDTDADSDVMYTFITSVPLAWDTTLGCPDIMSEVPVTAAAATSAAASALRTATPLVSMTSVATPLRQIAPNASSLTPMTATYSASDPSASAASASTSATTSQAPKIIIALVVLGGLFYYAKKKGMV